MIAMKPKIMSPQALFTLTSKRSEYSDEIARMNKKEELMLSRQLRVFERQERVAQSILKKHRREAERLDRIVSERSRQSINLEQYDIKRAMVRASSYGNTQESQSLAKVQLPALGFSSNSMTSRSKPKRNRPRVTRHIQIMSMRAMKTGIMVEEVESTLNKLDKKDSRSKNKHDTEKSEMSIEEQVDSS